MSAPPAAAVEAIEAGTSQIIRRIEFYEQDGTTPWYPTGSEEDEIQRLVDGTVTATYGSSERRKMDLTLDNSDGLLRPRAGGLWYDKIIKVFRGVRYGAEQNPPTVAIVEATSTSAAWSLRSALTSMGYTRTDVLTTVTSAADVANYDIVVSSNGATISAKGAMLRALYDAGVHVVTIGTANDGTVIPYVTAGTATAAVSWGIAKPTGDSIFGGGSWTTETQSGTYTGYKISTISSSAYKVAQHPTDSNNITASAAVDNSGGKWFDLHTQDWNGTNRKLLLKQALDWMRNYQPYLEWEVQVGEFMIDNVSDQRFPHTVKVVGRDYTKRCMLSKFSQDLSFPAGTQIDDLIRALAANSGITRMRIAKTTESLAQSLDVARGTSRWEIMYKVASEYGFELYFDPQGVLIMEVFIDRWYAPVVTVFKTGEDGNLVDWSRTVDDSQLYNHVVVYSSNSDNQDSLPFFGEAKNTEPSSPTNINELGDRLMDPIETITVKSDKQARQLALQYLSIAAMESYAVTLSSITYAWLDAGQVIGLLDPDRTEDEPTRFFMDSLGINLGPGPMSVTAKRVTLVGDPGNTIIVDSDGNIVSTGDIPPEDVAARMNTGTVSVVQGDYYSSRVEATI